MSNNKVYGTSVKDYAAQRGKTVQAVYQQMKRKENAAALECHILTHRVGNKDVKFLDDTAISILDESSSSAPLTIIEDGLKEELTLANQEVERLKTAELVRQGEIKALKELLEKKELQLLGLAEPQAQIDSLKRENSDLKADKEKLGQKIDEVKKTNQEANKEAWRQYSVALEIYNALPWWKKRRVSAPVAPGEKE